MKIQIQMLCDVLSFLRFVFCRETSLVFVWWLVSKPDQLIIFDFFDICVVYVNKRRKRTCVNSSLAVIDSTHPRDLQNLLTRPQYKSLLEFLCHILFFFFYLFTLTTYLNYIVTQSFTFFVDQDSHLLYI